MHPGLAPRKPGPRTEGRWAGMERGSRRPEFESENPQNPTKRRRGDENAKRCVCAYASVMRGGVPPPEAARRGRTRQSQSGRPPWPPGTACWAALGCWLLTRPCLAGWSVLKNKKHKLYLVH